MDFSAIIVAAGSGERAGAGGPKQWRLLGGKPVARWSLEAFLNAGAREVVVVVPPGGAAHAEAVFAGLERWRATEGGAHRAQSVTRGLAALGGPLDEVVLIHDAARPFVSAGHIRAVVEALKEAEGAAPALAMADTLKAWNGDKGPVTGAPRDGLWRVQTPQGFRRNVIEAAYGLLRGDTIPTDDLAVLEAFGGHAVLVPGDPLLMKLTYPEDFLMAERLAGAARITRIGQGFDVHRIGPGDGVWLCGLKIPHDGALVGHSDADAGLHALTDALLGAIGEGDIGDHFPPTDPTWKGAASDIFLRHAAKLIAGRGGEIINVDLTLICEAPKIKPHRQAMRERVAEILGLAPDRVSIKATTTEKLGFTGRGEGLAAQAVAAVTLPI